MSSEDVKPSWAKPQTEFEIDVETSKDVRLVSIEFIDGNKLLILRYRQEALNDSWARLYRLIE